MAKKVRDSAIVITGASSGIGRATALACAERGASLVLTARRQAALDELARECEQSGGRAFPISADVNDLDALKSVAHRAIERFGRIDVWFNNAAVTIAGQFEECPPDVYDQVIKTNLFGTINGARAVLPWFREQGYGVLINNSSVLSQFGASHFSAYSTSKFAVTGFSESLRQELRDTDIEVCVLMPAAIDTPLFNQAANYSGREVRPVEPVYTADLVARAAMSLMERPRRERIVGNAGRAVALARVLAPKGVTDRLIASQWENNHFKPQPAAQSPGNVFKPDQKHATVSGGWSGQDGSNMRYFAAGLAVAALPALYFWKSRSRNGTIASALRFLPNGSSENRIESAGRFLREHSSSLPDLLTRR